MGEKWLTSGRAQIKAMQRRSSFVANVTARAVLNERPSNKTRPAKAIQSNQKLKYRSGNLRSNYSAHADPIFRRAVVGQGSQNAEETLNNVIQPSQRRRIRDHSALYSHYNPRYGMPKAREVICQVTPQTLQCEAENCGDRMGLRIHSEHNPGANCDWFTGDQHSHAMDSSTHLYADQNQMLSPAPHHLPGIQPFQDHSYEHQDEFQTFPFWGDRSEGESSFEQRRYTSLAHETQYYQKHRALSDTRSFKDQGIFTAPSPQLLYRYDSVRQIESFLPPGDMSSHILDSFPGLGESFNEYANDEFFPEEPLISLPNEEVTESLLSNSVEYCIDPELPKENPIPNFVSIWSSTGIARFQKNGTTSLTLASTEKEDHSFHIGDELQPQGLMLPPRGRDYNSRSQEYHMDEENEVVRALQTWKENPAIRFFNEKIEVDAENRPLSRPGSPLFKDELNLLGKKSLWE